MIQPDSVDVACSLPGKPATKRFRRAFAGTSLTRDQAAREGSIARLAWERLGQDAAKRFLNSHHEGLAGRPLDIATTSAEGYSSTEKAIEGVARALSPQNEAN